MRAPRGVRPLIRKLRGAAPRGQAAVLVENVNRDGASVVLRIRRVEWCEDTASVLLAVDWREVED